MRVVNAEVSSRPRVSRKPVTPGVLMRISHFEKEFLSQPQALARVWTTYRGPRSPLRKLSALRPPPSILFLGMGSSLFAAYPAVCFLSQRGVTAQALDASEFLHYHLSTERQSFLVLISQSGESPEVNRIAEKLRRPYLAVVNDPRSRLARTAPQMLPLLAGVERGTTNKTYTNTVAVCLLLAGALTGEHQPFPALLLDAMTHLLEDWRETLAPFADFLEKAGPLDLVARGPSLASIWQGSLLLRELADLKTTPFSAGQFRHGPLATRRKNRTVILVAPRGRTQALTLSLGDAVMAQGGQVILLTDRKRSVPSGSKVFPIPSVGEYFSPLYEILFFELLGALLAERRGRVPGAGVTKITRSE